MKLSRRQALAAISTATGGSAALAVLFAMNRSSIPSRSGTIYVADRSNHRIRSIRADGTVATVAGSQVGYRDGPADQARFTFPFAVAADSTGRLVVSDQGNQKLRLIEPGGRVSTLAGSVVGFADGPGPTARFDLPYGVTIADNGVAHVADVLNHRIRRISTDGVVDTVAGNRPGFADGPGESARFNEPSGVTTGASGLLFVADRANHRIRAINREGTVTTIAGGDRGFSDGRGVSARFNRPTGIVYDHQRGRLLVTETANHCIRVVTLDGEVRTLAGGQRGFSDGGARIARFNEPCGVAVDRAGVIYVADRLNHRIRAIDTTGIVETLCGSEFGFEDGPMAEARFDLPYGLAFVED